MLLSNQKLVIRGTKMIMDELGYDEAEACRLLLLYGSVQKVLEAEKK
jgi:N-acetylmuramic acid 6-phosphate etherase